MPNEVRPIITLVTEHRLLNMIFVDILAGFVRRPADRSARHSGDDSRPHTLEETPESFSSPQQPATLHKSIDISQFRICGGSSRLEHSLDHIHWRCKCGCETSGNSSCCAMRHRIITFVWIESRRNRFVGEELKSSEWYSHGKRSWVGDIERRHPLCFVYIS